MTLLRDTHDVRHITGTEIADMDSPRALFPFPRMDASSQSLVRHRNNLSTLSLSSRISLPNRVTTLEVYDLMYGDAQGATSAETVDRLYEANAADNPLAALVDNNGAMDAVYENPLITASSRQIIADINSLSRQLRELDVPRPTAMFKMLFYPQAGDSEQLSEPWFKAMRMWSDIEDICDSESFDGHHMSVIEHTLNILLLPGLHSDARGTDHLYPDLDASALLVPSIGAGLRPSLAIPGLRGMSLPSPLHLKLHVLTRLSFNEQHRITRHRDLWDVRDVLGLVPGMQAAQWIGTRAAAHGLSWATHVAGWVFRRKNGHWAGNDDEESAAMPASTGTEHAMNALGLHLDEGSRAWAYVVPGRVAAADGRVCQAPDEDRDDGT